MMGPSEIATIVPERSAMPRQLFGSAKPDGPTIAIKGVLGGFLMGLANLVPGISGGTMLLAVGIYPQFIRGVAEVSTFRFSARTLLLLGCVACAAAVSIVGLAGIVKDLVIDHRWIMYSLFIGLTLGGGAGALAVAESCRFDSGRRLNRGCGGDGRAGCH